MVNLILGGIGLGLVLSFMLGPVFFVLIETSIKKGIRSALFMDLGVLISDIMYVSIAFIFVNQIASLQESNNSFWFSIVGGVVFVLFGITTFRKKEVIGKKKMINPNDLKANNYFSMAVKGFFLNAVNPGVLFYWLTIITTLRGKPDIEGVSENQMILMYLLVIIGTYFFIDFFKIIGAKKLKNILTNAWMKVINTVLGIVLTCFGAFFIFRGILMASGKL